MIDWTTLFIFVGFMLTGAVFFGYPIGLVIGKRRTRTYCKEHSVILPCFFCIYRQIPSETDILDAETLEEKPCR